MLNIKDHSSNFKISAEEYVARVKACNPDIEIISPYKGITRRIKARCLKDGYEWETVAQCLYTGHCPRCSKKERKTPERFEYELSIVNPDVELLSPYIRALTKVKCRCKIDGNVFEMTPSHLLYGNGCPQCGGVKRKDTNAFISEMAKIQPEIEVIGEYVNNKTPILLRCIMCGMEWTAAPNALIKKHNRGTGCPHCNSSKGEKKIAAYLKTHKFEYYSEYIFDGCKYIHRLPFDFYLPSLNTVIEYDGEQHFYCVDFSGNNPERARHLFELVQLRDEIKSNYCAQNNINLIRIPYTEYDNIEKILEERL